VIAMMPIDTYDDTLCIKTIEKEDFTMLLEWYNQIDKYKYATGLDSPISLEQLNEKYLETLVNTQEFYLIIYLKGENIKIGNIKGHMGYNKPNQCWITSMLIDENYQSRGLGTKAINLLFDYLKNRLSINDFYASVMEENKMGVHFWLKNGFKKVRVAKDFFRFDGKYQNAYIMNKHEAY
jgi:RimJ/RimL family protein N-acetyltransferase